MKKITILLLIFCISITCGCQKQENNSKTDNNQDNIVEENKEMEEFEARINITMNELNGNEKYYYFNEYLPSNSSKVGKINSGDLMLYGSDCLVLFYDSFNTSYSYTRIGVLDNPEKLKEIVGNGNINVNISK